MSDLIDDIDEDIAYQKQCQYPSEAEYNDALLIRISAELTRLRAIEAANQWVPFGERLPKAEGYYLAVVDGRVGMVYFNGAEFPYHEPGELSHWMPLPAPPTASTLQAPTDHP